MLPLLPFTVSIIVGGRRERFFVQFFTVIVVENLFISLFEMLINSGRLLLILFLDDTF